ncbi:MAG: lipopolysaccharide biosynthesis protein [Planctomycetaceae bacterium]
MKWKPSAWLSDALSALLVRAVGIVLVFVSTTMLARFLGPAEFGTYSSALGLAMLLATLAPLGTDRILSQTLACAITKEKSGNDVITDSDSAKAIAAAYRCTTTSLGVLLTLLFVLASIGLFTGVASEWMAMALAATLILVPLTLSYLRQWTAMPIIGTSKSMLAEQTLLPAAMILVVLISNVADWSFSALSMAAIYATASAIIFVVSISFGRLRDLHGAAFMSAFGVRRQDIAAMMRRGLPLVAVSAGAVASQSTLPMAIAAGCGFENAACFALAIPYATLPAVPLGVLGLSLIPQCARLHATGEMLQANHCVRSAATLAFWSAFAIAACVWLVSSKLTQILGPQYHAVVDVMPVLLLAVLIDCLTGPTVPVMQTMGLQGFYAKAFFGHWPLQILLVIALGGTWGLIGAATGYLIARAIWNLLIVIQIHRSPGLLMLPYLNPLSALAADQDSLMPGLSVSAKARTA